MKFEDIHIGDAVRIRQYEDMAQEFGDPENVGFVYGMRYLCGQVFTVSDICQHAWLASDETNFDGYAIVAQMVEPAEQVENTADELYEYIDISTFLER